MPNIYKRIPSKKSKLIVIKIQKIKIRLFHQTKIFLFI